MDKDAFRILRKGYKLTQEQIGKRLGDGYSRQAVIHWEAGTHPLPYNIEDLLVKAELALPAKQEAAGKPITAGTHPACYRPNPTHKGAFIRTLNHPKWWKGVGSPFEQLCSASEWEALNTPAKAIELATYTPPTPEQARDQMMARGISHAEAINYLGHMGYSVDGWKAEESWVGQHYPDVKWKT